MTIKGNYPVTISITPNVDSMLNTLEHYGLFDVSEEGEPLIIRGTILARCEHYPGRMWMPNGDPGYPEENYFTPEVDAKDIESALSEIYTEFEISVEVGEFDSDE